MRPIHWDAPSARDRCASSRLNRGSGNHPTHDRGLGSVGNGWRTSCSGNTRRTPRRAGGSSQAYSKLTHSASLTSRVSPSAIGAMRAKSRRTDKSISASSQHCRAIALSADWNKAGGGRTRGIDVLLTSVARIPAQCAFTRACYLMGRRDPAEIIALRPLFLQLISR
jgi:hypothetical protein